MDGPPTTPGGQAEALRIRGRIPTTHGPRGLQAGTSHVTPYQIIAGGGVTLRHRAPHPVSRLAAASEQWTGWNWPANSQNYNSYNRWAGSADYSSWSFGGGSLAEGWGPKHVPNKTDGEKPEKYLGDITQWLR